MMGVMDSIGFYWCLKKLAFLSPETNFSVVFCISVVFPGLLVTWGSIFPSQLENRSCTSDVTKLQTLVPPLQKTTPSAALTGRRSRWPTFSPSRPSARCSPALRVPNAPETLCGSGWRVPSAASARAAPSRSCPITSRRRPVRKKTQCHSCQCSSSSMY